MNSDPVLMRSSEVSPYGQHVSALDGLRGVAVLAVMSSHLFPGTARSGLLTGLRMLLATGATGVDLFFVLSGFLITSILMDTLVEQHFFRIFYSRRMLRIFPLYYAILGFYALGAFLLGMHFNGELWSLGLYLQNTSILRSPIYAYRGPSRLPLSHFWSLAIEEQFYLVWPLVVYWLRSCGSLLAVCLFFVVLCPVLRTYFWMTGWSYEVVHQNTLLRADALLSGGALALLLRSCAHDRVLYHGRWLALSGAVLAGSLVIALSGPGPVMTTWKSVGLSLRYSAFNMLYFGLIAMALQPGLFQKVCELRPLRALGKYSYGLYVFHLILFSYLQVPIEESLRTYLTSNKLLVVGSTGGLIFLLSLLVAIASYHLYEKHFLNLKRFVDYKHRDRNKGRRHWPR